MKKVYSRIEAISGNVITVTAGDVRYGDLAVVSSGQRSSLAEVIRLYENKVSLQVFAGSRGISTGDKVRFLGHPMQVSFSDNLLGRIFDGGGKPRDKGPELGENMIEIGGPAVNPAMRMIPRNMIPHGHPHDRPVELPGWSPRNFLSFRCRASPTIPCWRASPCRPKSTWIVLGGMGLKYDDYLFFEEPLGQGGALSRAVFFVHTASDPMVDLLLVPDIALAVAEGSRPAGQEGPGPADRYDQFRRRPGDRHHHEQVPSNRGSSRRSLQPARRPLRESG